ncbi:hypothetical protein [Pseudomonas sp. EA_35y_Pfl2_R5]|uniref:hypothetical protein n=1 Tax=Pseudomonas sp. EA_35y_Pfl2_R5 TaxID=3088690 RepID=UPI0030DAE60F
MSFIEKTKEAILSKAVEASIASISALLLFIFYQISPVIITAIESAISQKTLLALLALSIVTNIFLLALVILTNSKSKNDLYLKFGVYWDKDKNAHCPICKNVLSTNNRFGPLSEEYYCNPCKKLTYTTNATGEQIPRQEAIERL